MESYNPIARIREEADSQAITIALEFCLRFFMASTIEDFRSIIFQISTVLEEKPQPIDPLEFLYKILLSESHERILFLKATELWGEESNLLAQAVGIEPTRWKITLKAGDDYREVEAEKDLNYHEYENSSFVITPKNEDGKRVFIDVINMYNDHS